jgi:quercetin dioxygenase-like cupin family protein
MNKFHYSQVAAEPVTADGAKGMKIQWLIDKKLGAQHIAMRRFEVAPGGHTPLHEHAWEHEVFILSGQGVIQAAEGEQPLGPGDVVFVPSGERHCFRNNGTEPLVSLCMVPAEGQTCRRAAR